MYQQVGPSHSLSPVYWEEWAAQYGMTIEQWYEQVKLIIQSDKARGYETIFDVHPDDLRSDYLSAYRAAARHAKMKGY